MKLYISLILILPLSFTLFGQVRRTTVKPKPAPEEKIETPKPEEIKPTQKVILEKTNGDKLTGLFVSGNADSLTIDISGTKVPISFAEIKVMWVGDAKPELPVAQIPATNYAADAIKSLKKLSAATDVGVNFQDYSRRVIDVKAEVEDSLSNITDESIKNEISSAMQAYVDAGTAWNEMIRYDFMLISYELGRNLQQKYSIPVDRSLSTPVMRRNAVLSTIWASAKKHIETAQNLKP